jgi:hypothetical protein
MASDSSGVASVSSVVKDVISTLRDSVVFLVFLLLLLAPGTIKQRLHAAGFTKGNIAGFEWQAELEKAAEQTKSAGESVEEVAKNYDELLARIAELEKKVTNPEVKATLRDIGETAEQSRAQLATADKGLKRSLATQQEIVSQVSPSAGTDSGWIYLGKVSEDKTTWAEGSPKTIKPTSPNLERGAKLAVRDDVYIRADGPQNARASAPVVSVAKVGETLDLDAVEYSHAKGGGWFIWAKVRRS